MHWVCCMRKAQEDIWPMAESICESFQTVAKRLMDLGPGGGEAGGRIVAAGTPEQIRKNENSITGKYI